MNKTIIIHDDCTDVLRSGYNIVAYTIYDKESVEQITNIIKEYEELTANLPL